MRNKIKTLTTLTGLFMTTTLSAQPIMNVFELGVQAGKTAQYDQVGEQNIRTSIATEQGTLAMYSLKAKNNPQMAYMVEIYADDTAYQTHRNSPQYKAFLQASPEILTEHKKPIAVIPQFLGDKKVAMAQNTRPNLVMVEVKAEQNQQFKQIISAEMAQSLKVESGVLAMYATTLKNEPNKWLFFEIYADDNAYQAHRQTPHFQDYIKQTAEMVVDKQYIELEPAYFGNKGGVSFKE